MIDANFQNAEVELGAAISYFAFQSGNDPSKQAIRAHAVRRQLAELVLVCFVDFFWFGNML